MARMISIHEYELKPGTSAARLEQTFQTAESRGLFELPGLMAHHFIKGVKGDRRDRYAAVWVYESREAWERLWGPLDRPRRSNEYPQKWRIWEKEFLAPILSSDPDAIRFTAYEELALGA